MGNSEDKTNAWLERLTVVGAVARGFVYLVIGGIALRAIGYTVGETKGEPGVFKTIAEAPLGRLLLAFVGAGLAAFGVARVLEAILIMRARLAESWLAQSAGMIHAIVDGTLAVLAFWIALDPSVERSGKAAEWAALLLAQPAGRWLLGLIGFIIVGVGFFQISRIFHLHKMKFWALCLAIYGRAVYALFFFLLGAFALVAGIFRSPGEVRGLGGALGFLQERIYGSLLLAVFGFGLITHGVMSAIEAVRASHETAEKES
ncbi:MAG: DUF1206 domain-containing protein [Spartobacteria bacterium]